MTLFVINVVVRCGEKTCASEPGVFCPHLGAKGFGTKPWCLHFGEELHDKDGWVQRCEKCLQAEVGAA